MCVLNSGFNMLFASICNTCRFNDFFLFIVKQGQSKTSQGARDADWGINKAGSMASGRNGITLGPTTKK